MIRFVKKLARSTKGQDLAEYGIALAVIAVGAAAVAAALATDIETLWTNAQTAIAGVL